MELLALDRTDRGIRRLSAALELYRELIRPDEQNPERQILYWIDHSKTDLTDEFRCFAIQREEEIIGFLQYSYFSDERIFFFEYFCIRDSKARGAVPSDARNEIEKLLAENYPPGFTIVFEVAHKRMTQDKWEPDRKRLKYFRRLGFRKVDFEYQYPVLQSYEGEFAFPADLMVLLPNGRTTVAASEMRTFLRCIYFKHYLRWDRPFLDDEKFGERERLISALYAKTLKEISDDAEFGTRGDDRRPFVARFMSREPSITALLAKLFSPRLLRLSIIIAGLVIVQRTLATNWLLVPLVLVALAIDCLLEDTPTSRRLFMAVLSRITHALRQT